MSDLKMHLGRPAAWIEVTGEDSFTFLQGQSTNDLRSPAPAPVTYGLWLDRKGKVVADSFILQESPDRFFLYSYYSPADTILERLEPYIVADDVALRDLTGTAAFAAIWGKEVDEALIYSGFERPDHGSFSHSERRFLFCGRRSRSLNVDLVVVGDDNEETIATLSAAVGKAGGELVGEAALERERIEACIPAVPRDVGASDLPQEGNLDGAAISYRKGCYLGQEVMSRIHSMGKVQRTLAQVRLSDEPAEFPAPLFNGPREVGRVRTAAGPAPLLGLALIRIDSLENTKGLALAPDGPPAVEIASVPNL